jgi:hypothetical protein
VGAAILLPRCCGGIATRTKSPYVFSGYFVFSSPQIAESPGLYSRSRRRHLVAVAAETHLWRMLCVSWFFATSLVDTDVVHIHFVDAVTPLLLKIFPCVISGFGHANRLVGNRR